MQAHPHSYVSFNLLVHGRCGPVRLHLLRKNPASWIWRRLKVSIFEVGDLPYLSCCIWAVHPVGQWQNIPMCRVRYRKDGVARGSELMADKAVLVKGVGRSMPREHSLISPWEFEVGSRLGDNDDLAQEPPFALLLTITLKSYHHYSTPRHHVATFPPPQCPKRSSLLYLNLIPCPRLRLHSSRSRRPRKKPPAKAWI